MEKNEQFTKKEKEEQKVNSNQNNNELLNLKKELSSKEEIILSLKKELELNNLKNNLNSLSVFPMKNPNYSLHKYDSYKNLNDELISNKTCSINKNKNILLEDIQNQISELNFQLRNKKNILKQIKNEKNKSKSKTLTNWGVNGESTVVEELKEIIKNNEEKKYELKNIIKIKNKEINKLKLENKNNKEENNTLHKKISEIIKEINDISRENQKIKNEQNYLNEDIDEIRKNNDKLSKENLKLKEERKLFKNYENEKNINIEIINKFKNETEVLNNKINNLLKDKEQLLLNIKNLSAENNKLIEENNKYIQENNGNAQENSKLIQENNKLIQENNKLSQENKELNKKNNKLIQENKELNKKNNELIQENKEINNNIKLNKKYFNNENNCNNIEDSKYNNSFEYFNNNNNNIKKTNDLNNQCINGINGINNNTERKNLFSINNNNNSKSQNYLYNESNFLKYSRNNNNKNNNTYFNYSDFPVSSAYRENPKLFKNDILFNNTTYTPKCIEVNKNQSIKKEEEKVNKDNEKYISSLNNQIYKLESQIEQLQNKVLELNKQNINIDKDKKRIKNYEEIIELEKNKTKKAENTILELRQEIEYLKKAYNSNINKNKKTNIPKGNNNKITLVKKNRSSTNDKKTKYSENKNERINISNKYDADINLEFSGLNSNSRMNKNAEKGYKNKEDFLTNSNDIKFRITNENENNDIIDKRARIYTISEDMSSLGNRSNNFDNNYNVNKLIENKKAFNKMKGSDIDTSHNKLYSYSNTCEETSNLFS